MEISQQTQEFIRSHRTENVQDLALHAKRAPNLDLPWALDQIAGWQTARTKLPQWANTDGIIYPPHLSMEQCSSQPTARYKAELASRLLQSADSPTESSPSRLIDLTGGFGVDFSAMAHDFSQAVYVERQPNLCDIARHNFNLLGLQDAQVVNADAESFLLTADHADIIFIDPARRDQHGGRTIAISDCTPDVLSMLELLTAKATYVLVKLSPMLDWHKAVNDCRGTVQEVHVVAVANECKELLLVLHGQPAASRAEDIPVTVYCVNITPHGTEQFTVIEDATGIHTVDTAVEPSCQRTSNRAVSSVDDALPFHYLYEPNAAIMKAGCFDALSSAYDLPQLSANSHLFISNMLVAQFPGRIFQVNAVMTMGKKDLKRGLCGLTHANITTRNFPMSVNQLRNKLKLNDGGDTYLFATTDRNAKHIIIRTTRV